MLSVQQALKGHHSKSQKSRNNNRNPSNNHNRSRQSSLATSAKSVSSTSSPTNNNDNNNSRNTTPLDRHFAGSKTSDHNAIPLPTKTNRALSRLRLRDHLEMTASKEQELYKTFKENTFYTLHILERFRSKQIAPAYRTSAIQKSTNRGTLLRLPPISRKASSRQSNKSEFSTTTESAYSINPIARRFIEESLKHTQKKSTTMAEKWNRDKPETESFNCFNNSFWHVTFYYTRLNLKIFIAFISSFIATISSFWNSVIRNFGFTKW